MVAIPTEGLDKLEVLRIQNTQSLKIIPSVFHFKNLQEAWLTHHFHCCAFIFPARHDPESFARLQKDLKRYQEQCDSEKVSKRTRRRSAAATSPTPSSLSRTTPSQTTDAAVYVTHNHKEFQGGHVTHDGICFFPGPIETLNSAGNLLLTVSRELFYPARRRTTRPAADIHLWLRTRMTVTWEASVMAPSKDNSQWDPRMAVTSTTPPL